jgi:hypothetical protein
MKMGDLRCARAALPVRLPWRRCGDRPNLASLQADIASRLLIRAPMSRGKTAVGAQSAGGRLRASFVRAKDHGVDSKVDSEHADEAICESTYLFVVIDDGFVVHGRCFRAEICPREHCTSMAQFGADFQTIDIPARRPASLIDVSHESEVV